MATGFTADIAEGKDVSFEKFVWRCARGMGATIMMRDEPMSVLPPEKFEPQIEYHKNGIEAARAEICRLKALTVEQIAAEARSVHADAVASVRSCNAKTALLSERYRQMIERVEAWTPPTQDHVGFKEFMLSQLRESQRFDAHQMDEPKQPVDYLAERIAAAESDIEYHEREMRAEIERTEARNKWLADLRASVPYPQPETGSR